MMLVSGKVRVASGARGTDVPLPQTPPDRLDRWQFTSLDANSNKWYDFYLWNLPNGSMRVLVKHGRVGDKGNAIDYGERTLREYEAMEKDRRRSGYDRVELAGQLVAPRQPGSLAALASGSRSTLYQLSPRPSEEEIALYIFQQASESIAKYLQGSVDALSLGQIALGRNILGQFKEERSKQMISERQLMYIVESYYKAIPTKLPRKIDPTRLMWDFDPADQENKLNQLEAAVRALEAQASGEGPWKALGARLEFLDVKGAEYASLLKMFEETFDTTRTLRNYGNRYGTGSKASTLKVRGIYRITSDADRAAWKLFRQRNPTIDTRLLFHGTRTANVRHILRQGLLIPAHQTNGRALGNGVYFANKSAKARNYCQVSVGAEGDRDHPYLMFASEVATGKMYDATSGSYSNNQNRSSAPRGYDSLISKAHGSYGFDEIVVYRTDQSTLRYLYAFEY